MRLVALFAVALLSAGCAPGTSPSGGPDGDLSDVEYGWSDAEYPPPHEGGPAAHQPAGVDDGGNVTPEEQIRADEVDALPDAPPHFNDGN